MSYMLTAASESSFVFFTACSVIGLIFPAIISFYFVFRKNCSNKKADHMKHISHTVIQEMENKLGEQRLLAEYHSQFYNYFTCL